METVFNATANRLTVKDALTLVNRHVARRTVIPVLSNVHVEACEATQRLTFTATDLDGTFEASVKASVTGTGSVLVSRETLAGTVKAGGETVGFRFEPSELIGTVHVDTGNTVGMPAGPMEDWPRLPDLCPSGTYYAVSPADRAGLGTVARFASTDVGRPVLTGVNIDGRNAAATDSYRLAVTELDPNLPSMLLPARYVKLVAGWKIGDPGLNDHVGLVASEPDREETRYVIVTGTILQGPKRARREVRVRFGFHTIAGSFPNYRALMPEPANVDQDAIWVHVDRDAAIAAVKGLEPVAKQANTPVGLKITSGRITFTASNQEGGSGKATVPARVQGPGFTAPMPEDVRKLYLTGPEGEPELVVHYNPTFLRDQLQAMPAGPVAVSIRTALKPARFDHVDTDLTGLLMPMRVS